MSAVVWGELIDELRHAHSALDARIVFEGKVRSSLEADVRGDARLQEPARRLETPERRLALLLAAQDADEDPRLAEIPARRHSRDRDEADPRVLEVDRKSVV